MKTCHIHPICVLTNGNGLLPCMIQNTIIASRFRTILPQLLVPEAESPPMKTSPISSHLQQRNAAMAPLSGHHFQGHLPPPASLPFPRLQQPTHQHQHSPRLRGVRLQHTIFSHWPSICHDEWEYDNSNESLQDVLPTHAIPGDRRHAHTQNQRRHSLGSRPNGPDETRFRSAAVSLTTLAQTTDAVCDGHICLAMVRRSLSLPSSHHGKMHCCVVGGR